MKLLVLQLRFLNQTVSVGIIQFEEDECHNRERQQRAAAITEIWQRNPNGGEKSHYHSEVYRKVH